MNSIFPKQSCNFVRQGIVQPLRRNVQKQRQEHRDGFRLGSMKADSTTSEFDCEDPGFRLLKHVVVNEELPMVILDHIIGKSRDKCHKLLTK